MGWKGKVLSEWGGALGRKVFGQEIPENVFPLLGKEAGSLSQVDANIFGKAIDFDPTVREPLDALLRNAADGDDNAYMLLEYAAKDFGAEDATREGLSKAQQKLAKRQRANWHLLDDRIQEAPTAKGDAGRRYKANVASIGRNEPAVDTGLPMQAATRQADPADYAGSSIYSGQANPLAGDAITQVHHGGGLDDLSWMFKHQSYQGVTPDSPHPLIEMGDRLFGMKIGNNPQNTVDILGMMNKRGRQAKVLALSEQVGDAMHSKTIDDLLGTSDYQPRMLDQKTGGDPSLEKVGLETEHLKRLQQQDPTLTVERYMAENKSPITGKAYGKGGVTTKIEIWKPGANIRKDTPLEVIKLDEKSYPQRVKLAFDALEKHGIPGAKEARAKWNNKLAKIDPKEDILGVDHPLVHEFINALKQQEGTALNTIAKMSDDEIFNLPMEDAFKLYVRQMQEMETVLANVLQYRYKKVKELFKEFNPKKNFEKLDPEEKQIFFRKNVNTIAVKGNVEKELSLKASLKPIKGWNNHISDVFGWQPQSLWVTIEEIEELAKEFAAKVPTNQPIPGVE